VLSDGVADELARKLALTSSRSMHGWYWLDRAVALVIAAVIGYRALMLIARVLVAIKTETVYRTWRTNGRGIEQLSHTFALIDILPQGSPGGMARFA
jgi:hypothetical protein